MKLFTGAFCAVALAALSGNAVAVPIHFEFTGINTGSVAMPEGSVQGQAVSGKFLFETNLMTRHELVPAEFGAYFQGIAFLDLTFGEEIRNFPSFGPQNDSYSTILFSDGCRSADCQSDEDSFGLFSYSAEITPAIIASGFTGTYRTAFFDLHSGKDFLPPLNLFDAATILPTAIVDLPLSTTVWGSYAEHTYSCVVGDCMNVSSSGFGFEVTSVNRWVEAHAVPEPDTLLLFAAALLALRSMRRCRAKSAR